MFSILIQVVFYLHQVVFFATVLSLCLWALSKLLPRGKVGSFDERFVLITGCDSGFGKETAIRLDEMGFRVFATCLMEKGAKSLKSSCSQRLVAFQMDVTKSSDIKHAYATVESHLPHGRGLWGLVNNAGITALSPIEWQHLDDFKNLADVNLWGMIGVTKTFLPLLRKAKGRVINFSSVGGSMTVLNFAAYCVTKYGVEGFSDALRREMRPWGVLVSIIAPGPFRTPIFDTEVIVERYRQVWDGLTSDVAQDYGEKFFYDNEAFLRAFSSDENCNPKTSQVVDAVVDAVTSQTPRMRYHVSSFPLNCVAWLPTWLGDKFLEVLVKEPATDQDDDIRNNNNNNNNNDNNNNNNNDNNNNDNKHKYFIK